MKKKKQIYNPRYGTGAMIKENLRSNMLRRSQSFNEPFNRGLLDAGYDRLFVDYTQPTEEDWYATYDENGEYEPKNDLSFLSDAYDWANEALFGERSLADAFKNFSVADSWRLFHLKRLQAELTNNEKQLADINEALGQLDEAEQYANLIDAYNNLDAQEKVLRKNNEDPNVINEVINAKADVLQQLRSMQENLKVDGKYSDVNSKLFFDPDKIDTYTALDYGLGKDQNIKENSWYDLSAGAKQLGSRLGNIIGSTVQGVKKIFGAGYGDFTRSAMRNSTRDDRTFDVAFKDYMQGSGYSVASLRNQISEMRKDYDRQKAEKELDVTDLANKYQEGSWYFDPKKINPKFRSVQEQSAGLIGGIVNPVNWVYSIPEIGTSWSDVTNMAGMIATDAGLRAGTAMLASFAARRNVYTTALFALAEADKLRKAGKAVEAAKMAESASKKIVNTLLLIDDLRAAGGIAQQGANLYFINRLREHETNSEVMDAWSSRVLQDSMRNGANMNKVLSATQEYLDNIGVSTDGANEIDLIQYALAYNVPTGDDVFEKIKKETRKGLNKVYNDNNSLAVMDYLEALPFLSYTKSFLRDFGRGLKNRAVESAIDKSARRTAMAMADKRVDAAANKIGNNLASKLAAKHSIKYLKNLAKKGLIVGTLEGFEEGQQQLLQSRYQRGEYDTYNQSPSLFAAPSVLEDGDLAITALFDYIGINAGDPDNGDRELRRAMQIGATTGILMSLFGGAASNVMPSIGQLNLRNLIAQLKNDKIVGNLIGESHGKAQDDEHIGIFFDAFAKRGVNIDRLEQSLLDLKGLKGSLVTDEYIDGDIELAREAWNSYNNPKIDEYLKKKGYERGSQEHKDIVRLNTRYVIDSKEAQRLSAKNQSELDNIQNSILFQLINEDVERTPAVNELLNKIKTEFNTKVAEYNKGYNELREKLNKRNPDDFKTSDGYMNPAQINQEIDRRLQEYESKKPEFRKFLEDTLNDMFIYRYLANAKDLIGLFASRENLLKAIEKEFGIDIDVNKLEIIQQSLDKAYDKLYQMLNSKSFIEDNSIRELLNQIAEQQGKSERLELRQSYAEQLEQKFGKFENQEEIDRLQQLRLLNKAVFDSIAPLVVAFNQGLADPIAINKLISTPKWNSLTDKQKEDYVKELNEKRKAEGKKPVSVSGAAGIYSNEQQRKRVNLKKDEEEYRKYLKDKEDTPESETYLTEDPTKQLILRDTATHLLDFELNQKAERRRVAHREYLEDSPITPNVVEKASEGDKDSKDAVEASLTPPPAEDGNVAPEGSSEGSVDTSAGTDDESSVDSNNGGEGTMESTNLDDLEDLFGYNDEDKRFRDRNGQNLPQEEGDEGEMEEDDETDDEETFSQPDPAEGTMDPEPADEGAYIQADIDGEIGSDEDLRDKITEHNVRNSGEVLSNFLYQTFFYLPEIDGKPNTKAISLKVGAEEIKLLDGAKLLPSGELAKRLAQPGWFAKTRKYFVFSGDPRMSDMSNEDNIGVHMIIQDGNDAFAVSMRSLATKTYSNKDDRNITFLSESDLIEELRSKFLDDEYKTPTAQQPIYDAAARSIYEQLHPAQHAKALSSGKPIAKEVIDKWYSEAPQEDRDKVSDRARNIMSRDNGRYISEAKIREQIAKLRQTRNQIIQAALRKDEDGKYVLLTEGYQEVKPLNARISNGRINSRRNDADMPAWRNATDCPFGMSKDTEELTKLLRGDTETAQVKIGVGRGQRAYAQNAISHVDPKIDEEYADKGGKAGKLYVIVETPNYKTSAVQLHEEGFRGLPVAGKQYIRKPEDVVEAVDEYGKLKEGAKLSIAELIFRLLTNQFSNKNITQFESVFVPKLKRALLEMLIHFGGDTRMNNRKAELESQFLAAKQLDNEEGELTLPATGRNGKWTSVSIPFENLFPRRDKTYTQEELDGMANRRRASIATIANNFHWNTERDALMRNLDDELLDPLRAYFRKHPKEKSVKILGINELEFSRDDLFDENLKKKDVSLLAWMLKAGKLKSDVGDTIFFAPWVYADGAQPMTSNQAAIQTGKTLSSNKNKTKLTNSVDLVDAGANIVTTARSQEEMVQRIESRAEGKGSQYDFGAGIKKILSKSREEVKSWLKEKGLIDAGILDIETQDPDGNPLSYETVSNNIKAAVKRYVDWYNSQHSNKINVEDVNMNYTQFTHNGAVLGRVIPTIMIKENGEKKIYWFTDANFANAVSGKFNLGVSGVYSRFKGRGKLNQAKATEWVKEVLGLDESQILVTSGILRSLSGEEIFGVTNVCADLINDKSRGYLHLSARAGKGVHFHEAFHYVNLLLHNKAQRQRIYRYYTKLHPELADKKLGEIEEYIAEDFRKYCENREGTGLIGWMKRMFQNFLDFAWPYRKKDLMRKLYDDIRSGGYKNMDLDEESVKEFKKKYPTGKPLANYSVAGVPQDVLDNFGAIKTYQKFFNIGEALAHDYVYQAGFTTPEAIRQAGKSSFEQYLTTLKDGLEFDDNPYIRDIVNNPVAFKYIIAGVLREYGIVGKSKDLNSTNLLELVEKKGQGDEDPADNVWDIDTFEINAKDNVAFKAKLFLRQIPYGRLVLNPVTKKYDFYPISDEDTGFKRFVDYDVVWNKVMDNLSMSTSYNDMMNRIIEKSETNAFFRAFYDKLKTISGNIELQNQIYSTVVKQVPQLATIQISEKTARSIERKRKKSEQADDTMREEDVDKIDQSAREILDQDKDLDILNDNSLKSLRSRPREWSLDLFLSSLVLYDEGSKAYILNEDIVDDLKQDLKEILNIGRFDKKLSTIKENEFDEINNQVKDLLMHLCLKMSLPMDEDTVDQYIIYNLNEGESLGDNKAVYKALKRIFAKPKSGNIRFFIESVFVPNAMLANTQLVVPGFVDEKGKPLAILISEVYNGYKNDTQIQKMSAAYNAIHTSPLQHSVSGPNGTLYPISENNYISDVINWLNQNTEDRIQLLSDCKYSKNSLLLEIAKKILEGANGKDLKLKLNAFVGMEEKGAKKGKDYFGITSLEDLVAKMLMVHNNMIILPTMADKKTWYAISLDSFLNNDTTDILKLPHDILVNQEFGEYEARRFSIDTLSRFAKYFLDELDTLDQYYSREHITAAVTNPNILKENYHGKIKDGRMDISGNGGMFRYFYDLVFTENEDGKDSINLNQLLQFRWEQQQQMEDPKYSNGLSELREDDKELDGFELVRKELKNLRQKFFIEVDEGEYTPNDDLLNAINEMLFARVDKTMQALSSSRNSFSVLGRQRPKVEKEVVNEETGEVETVKEIDKSVDPYIIPRAIPNQLVQEYKRLFKAANYNKEDLKSLYTATKGAADIALSIVGNFVAGSMISTIEVEKVITGDPAFYKWKYFLDKNKKRVQQKVTIDGITLGVDILDEKDTDKIKRLGSVLSPGSELRLDYTEDILKRFPELRGRKYTNANISDISAKSVYIDDLKLRFGKQLLADYVRKNRPDQKLVVEDIYYKDGFYQELLSKLPKEEQDNINEAIEKSIKPYNDITVSDAEVLIRPALYRKIRIGLGEWSFEPIMITYKVLEGDEFVEKTTTYSDEEAYNIVLNNGEWMSDPELSAKVSRLQLKPLKMTYFANDPINFGQETKVMMPTYNKMAIFPMFKYAAQSETGKKIYKRMNKKDNELDMISFESAVKVGLNATRYAPHDKKTTNISTLNELLERDSDNYIDENGNQASRSGNNLMAVRIQDLSCIRMQLNTDAHTDSERSIGTQMFKIMFSNLYDDEDYCKNKEGRPTRKGSEIREDIMKCISALTAKGVHKIKNKYFDKSTGNVDPKKVKKLLKRIVLNNGLGAVAQEIIENDYTISSLMSRTLFEQSVTSLVNDEVISINTKGGSAILQSVFGFVSYNKKQVSSQEEKKYQVKLGEDEYHILAGGKELEWNKEDGTMEVMLSMNFFKAVVPSYAQTSYKTMRLWLINHDVIMGKKSDGTMSKPKPFGVGYRIPTQGLSSTFAFTVADVLPEQSGDLIIVPREFTAQTGSDYDVDKLFLATMSYKDGKLEQYDGDNLEKATSGQIANRLIQNYIDVVTDIKNFANARASIDVVTDIIKDEVLTILRSREVTYANSMYELTPEFLAKRKQEFSVGKNGIGPFALNITNLALTQYTHLSIEYEDEDQSFGFGELDEIVGEDGLRISDWLSAMVNAHVDVAKDPYVFALNVNNATYNHVNFLLRAGKGKKAFLFIAQPILKQYADIVNNKGGLYGKNLSKKKKNLTDEQQLYELIKDNALHYINKVKKDVQDEAEQKRLLAKMSALVNNKFDSWGDVFDEKLASQALKDPKSIDGLYFQVLAGKAFIRMTKYADALSDLVKCSRIDTKKFGNTISLHRNFLNTYNQFRYGEPTVKWKIHGPHVEGVNPLSVYFDSTFLSDKLDCATLLVKEILRRQSFVATDSFGSIINTVFGELYGYADENNHSLGYKIIKDDDKITSVANAVENVIRSRALFDYGVDVFNKMSSDPVDVYSDYESWKKREEDNDYTGPIDFTFGGDKELAIHELRRIFFGDSKSKNKYEKNSVFVNLSRIIGAAQEKPNDKKYEGITDENGAVINEFLNFLKPQPATEEVPIPRLLLKRSQMNTGVDEKLRLQSAFDFLLRHNNPEIRRVARDIAVYAYYSTYDTNTVNSFFDLVPLNYRAQYDKAIAEAISLQDTSGILSLLGDGASKTEASVDSLIDIVCRNYYMDDDIVPRYRLSESNKQTIDKEFGEYTGELVTDEVNGNITIPSTIITRKEAAKYMKIISKGQVSLYKKVGAVVQYDKKGNKVGTPWNCYILTLKLGVHSGKTHHYEFIGNLESIFELNEMPYMFDQELAMGVIDDFMDASEEVLKKNQRTCKYISYDTISLIHENNNEKYKDIDEGVEEELQFLETDKPLSEIADYVFDISKGVNKAYEDLVAQIGTFDTSRDTESPVYVSGEPEVKVKKSDIKKYVNEQVQRYEERLDESLPKAIKDQKLADYRAKVESVAEQMVKQREYEKVAMDIVSELAKVEDNIDTLVLKLDSEFNKALYKAAINANTGLEVVVAGEVEPTQEELDDIINNSQLVLADDEQEASESAKRLIDDTMKSVKRLEKKAKDQTDDTMQSNEIDDDQSGEMSEDTANELLSILGESSNSNENGKC